MYENLTREELLGLLEDKDEAIVGYKITLEEIDKTIDEMTEELKVTSNKMFKLLGQMGSE